jgi:hypothetical protein
VRAPAATPVVDSTNEVTLVVPQTDPTSVPKASVIMAR